MRKFLALIILFAFMVIFSNPDTISGANQPQKSPEVSSGGPKAYFSETSWDFGRIPLNCGVSHIFWLKNVGTDTLKILSVKPG